jgi:succinate dehydrogenase flavin-adding protein (antitoxin of CptAB toxin-antitoxin module)
VNQADKNRLYWKCRRGLLELDIVLNRYLLKHPEDDTLSELLDLPDNDLWDLVSGRCDPLDERVRAAVERLRAC